VPRLLEGADDIDGEYRWAIWPKSLQSNLSISLFSDCYYYRNDTA